MTAQLFDATRCELGEGPLWHPQLGQLFWFDITGRRLMTRKGDKTTGWDMPEIVSAAGWIDDSALFLAGETGFFRFDLASGTLDRLADLERQNPQTRSNDGRADPEGGFWIGTMGKAAEPRAGAIYRYYRGEVRRLWGPVTIPNAICFSPDGLWAYFADTRDNIVRRWRLGANGWPVGEPETFLDLNPEGWRPDGAVTDARGHFWNAQWGGHRVAEYDPSGRFIQAIDLPPANTTCPAFGGPGLTTLFCTSALQGIPAERREAEPAHGQTFAVENAGQGLPEPQVIP